MKNIRVSVIFVIVAGNEQTTQMPHLHIWLYVQDALYCMYYNTTVLLLVYDYETCVFETILSLQRLVQVSLSLS